MVKNVLEADSIIYRIGHKNLLTDIYVKCITGELVGILGRNGCGKSSLLKIIFGTLRAENKSISVNKTLINKPYIKGNLISYLPQDDFLPKGVSVKEIISKYISQPAQRNIILNDPHVNKHLNKRTAEMSGGELRYFQVLLLLNLESTFVLLDEPFSSVEPLYREKIKSLIKAYKHKKGFLITDHDYRNVMDLCDEIRLITNGVCKYIKDMNQLELWGYVPEGTFNFPDS
jgi:ABC-type multidrug transport system ATPase subunit